MYDCINFLLTRTQKTVAQYFTEKISDCDVTPVQYAVLSCLWDNDFQLPSQIAQTLNLDSSSITGLLDRMENKGLLKRIPNSEDRRALHVILTPKGKDLRDPLDERINEAHKEVLSTLSVEEQELLLSYLPKIVDNVLDMKKS